MKQIAQITFYESPEDGGVLTEFSATPEYFNNESEIAQKILRATRNKFIEEAARCGLFKGE